MPRYRPDTPAARLRDAPRLARRRARQVVRAVIGSYLALCLAALLGVAATAPGAGTTQSPATASVPAANHPAAAPDVAVRTAPDGRVEKPGRSEQSLPPGWSEVGPLLAAAVRDADRAGYELAACVLAIDAPDERVVCAGQDDPRYAASVIKVAYAVGALEAWGADTSAVTPYGTLDDLVDLALSVSDNEAANHLYDLSVTGPRAPATDDPVAAMAAPVARVAPPGRVHPAGAFRFEWTGDWSRVNALGSVAYLAELVRAADGRAPSGRALTSPAVARIVLAAMLEQERQWKLPGRLPEGTAANKTGETTTESHDIAVVNTASGRYAVAVIASSAGVFGGPDVLMADLGFHVVRALGGAARF